MNNLPICYLVGAGERNIMTSLPTSADFIIAVDGGLIYLEEWGIIPDLVVGDFDSLSKMPVTDDRTIVLPKEKDDTDMVAAVREGWRRGFRVFYIYGGTGGRLDHTLANIQLLADIAERGGRGYLFDRNTVITSIHNSVITFPPTAEGVISVFSHTDISTGVYEKGLKYPLTNATLRNTYPLGISNEFTGTQGSITVQSGTLIIIYPQKTQEERL